MSEQLPVFGPFLPSWLESPEIWDTVHIAGVDLPGLCTVESKRASRHDTKQTPGSSGATQTHLGYEPSEILIVLRMWTTEHWQSFQSIAARLQPPPRKTKPQPVDVSHPALAVYGIAKLYVAELTTPKMSSTRGVFEVTIRGTEWDPTKKSNELITPKSSKTDIANKSTAITPRLPSQQEIKP